VNGGRTHRGPQRDPPPVLKTGEPTGTQPLPIGRKDTPSEGVWQGRNETALMRLTPYPRRAIVPVSMSLITLMTDFGLKDGNVGAMKGVILGIAPRAQIVDLSHFISPQNVPEAALILRRSAPYFPPGTIHVVVVDPGVGTSRRPIAAQLGMQRFVGPDNGVITLLLDHAEQQGWPVTFVHLDRPQFWLPEISPVFHGRDIFAPAAAHLATGAALSDLGMPVSDPVRLALPHPERTPAGWRGEIIHIDHFGNLASNILSEHLPGWLDAAEKIAVRLCGVEICGLVKTFGERSPGELAALFGSTGNLIVSVVNGSAAEALGAKVGDPCEVERLLESPDMDE
jgi:S-adenosylmethionine hydrolase